MWPFRKQKKEFLIERPMAVPSVLEDLDGQRRYTPDLARLEMIEHHHLFVIGEMQAGHHQSDMIADDERTGVEAFSQRDFHFLMNDLGVMSHPLLFPSEIPSTLWKLPLLPVKGEIVKIKPRRFLELDKYYHNTVRFVRLPIMIVIPLSSATFKDREVAQKAFGKTIKARPTADGKTIRRMAGDLPMQTATVHRKVYRMWAQTYFAPPSYWYELLSDYNNPPVKTFHNPNGIVKNYSRFTVDEYDPPF